MPTLHAFSYFFYLPNWSSWYRKAVLMLVETWLTGLILLTDLFGAEFDAAPTEQLMLAP